MGSVGLVKATQENPYPRTFEEFLDWFSVEEDCAAYLAWIRWPAGFVCPVCGYTCEKEAPEVCPVCGAKGKLFKKVE